MQPFRIIPQLGAQHYKTYAISAPLSTHFRDGACEEVGCAAQEYGWATNVDESTELGQRQAHYIRKLSGRSFTERRTELGLTAFSFPAGQRCFAIHKVPLDREEIYLVQGGDWRGNPYGTPARVHTRPEFWTEDFAEHQQHIADRIDRG